MQKVESANCAVLQNTQTLIYTLVVESKKGGGGRICADLPGWIVGERPNGAQRRSLGHADVPSCTTSMLSDPAAADVET